MKPIISVEGLGKKYVIRHEGQTHYKSLREELFQLPKKLFSRQDNKEKFWALKDVSFDIMPGDRVGIIGRNGAGKSTLLKLLSRITEPSAGRITMRGRVASLLEVGTGFHPELTGRENIFLNGAILGMSRAEVRYKFDEIVDFAGVEKFLDTPVKRYSSGMYVRLAFSVAAHLDPEIMIVDEVLAVGDADFQKKCLGKMEEVSELYGRTLLFVSHNMSAIHSLTSRCLHISGGNVLSFDNTTDVVSSYLNFTEKLSGKQVLAVPEYGLDIELVPPYQLNFLFGAPLVFNIILKNQQLISGLWIGFQVISPLGVRLATIATEIKDLSKGETALSISSSPMFLPPANYCVHITGYFDLKSGFFAERFFSFEVVAENPDVFMIRRGAVLGAYPPTSVKIGSKSL
ncbi:MAG: ABC transporter ATP-binding protein [Desulfomicrobium sp.]